MSLEDKGFPSSFQHPSAGPSEVEPHLLAVRWQPGIDRESKLRLIGHANLVPAEADHSRQPAPTVNQTDGLWWVRPADDTPVSHEVIDGLEASADVEWVAPGYRAVNANRPTAVAAPSNAAVYTVNPTRIYVHRPALDLVGAVTDLSADTSRRNRMPDHLPMRVRAGTALTAVNTLTTSLSPGDAPKSGAVRLETIPFLSPTTSTQTSTAPFTPDDPDFGRQWGLQRIKAPQAWQIVRGDADITIAVIDEGVELAHPDLDVFPQSWNASNDTPNGGPTGNHGTACAGIAAARLGNALGVAGVAGGAKVMAIATETWADVDIAEGLYFATDNGARVVSMSFGVYPAWGVWDFDLIRDALQHAYDQGVLLVAAAGNENEAVARFPGSDARTLCVGGSNRSDERKRVGDSSSEPFWGASHGPDLDVVAPCLEIPTTDRLANDGYGPGDYFARFNGTSAATPHVAGLAALLFSLRPELDHVEVRHLIESTCDKISPARYPYRNVATKPSGTWHEEVGYGRINAERALHAANKTTGCPEDVV